MVFPIVGDARYRHINHAMADVNEPLRKLDAAVIAPRPTRHYRAAAFQAYVLMASGAFVVLAVGARIVPYFPVDLTITRFVQSYHGVIFDRSMFAMSWIGFLPQSLAFGLVPILILFVADMEIGRASCRERVFRVV